MENKRLKVIVDSDAIIARANPLDAHHKEAVEITNNLNSLGVKVIYPATTVAESTAYMQRVLNSNATAYGTASLMTGSSVEVAEVNQETIRGAMKYFSVDSSKENTLFDCIVASIAETEKADAIFSFDKFYTKKGFKLASEL